MEDQNDEDMPFSDKILGAIDYLYFWRRWWPEGADVAIFWRNGSGHCRRFCAASGGMSIWDPSALRPQVIVSDDDIDCRLFDDFVRTAVESGAFEVPAFLEPITTAHCSDTYDLKLGSGRRNRYHIDGARSKDARLNRLMEEVFLDASGLLAFYERERAGE